MTDVISTIHTAGGADYTTMAAWEAATDIDLVSAEIKHIGIITGTLSQVGVVIGGATTNSSFYRVVAATGGGKHDGTSGTGATIRTADDSTTALQTDGEHFVHISGLEFDGNGKVFGAGPEITPNAASSGCVIDSCLVYNGGWNGIAIRTNNTNVIVRNNVIWNMDFNGILIDFADSNMSFNIENNTIYNCNLAEGTDGGIRTNPARANYPNTIHNNICLGSFGGDNDFWDNGTTNISLSGNMSQDESALGALATTGILASDTFKSIDATNINLAPKNSGVACIDAGVTIAGFAHDISGVARPNGDSWDIGAFEFELLIEEPHPQFGKSINFSAGVGKIRF